MWLISYYFCYRSLFEVVIAASALNLNQVRPPKAFVGFLIPPTTANMAKQENVSPTTTRKVFEDINERPVDDIQMEIFYRPRSLTLRTWDTYSIYGNVLHVSSIIVLLCIFGLTYTAFVRDSTLDHQSNLFAGK